jgi:hypothetical protein
MDKSDEDESCAGQRRYENAQVAAENARAQHGAHDTIALVALTGWDDA